MAPIHATQVHIQHPVNLLILRLVRQLARAADARVVDRDVQPAESPCHIGDALLHLRAVADVKVEGQDLEGRVLLLEGGDGRVQVAFVDVSEGETGDAVAREGDGCLFADAWRCERDTRMVKSIR